MAQQNKKTERLNNPEKCTKMQKNYKNFQLSRTASAYPALVLLLAPRIFLFLSPLLALLLLACQPVLANLFGLALSGHCSLFSLFLSLSLTHSLLEPGKVDGWT